MIQSIQRIVFAQVEDTKLYVRPAIHFVWIL